MLGGPAQTRHCSVRDGGEVHIFRAQHIDPSRLSEDIRLTQELSGDSFIEAVGRIQLHSGNFSSSLIPMQLLYYPVWCNGQRPGFKFLLGDGNSLVGCDWQNSS